MNLSFLVAICAGLVLAASIPDAVRAADRCEDQNMEYYEQLQKSLAHRNLFCPPSNSDVEERCDRYMQTVLQEHLILDAEKADCIQDASDLTPKADAHLVDSKQ